MFPATFDNSRNRRQFKIIKTSNTTQHITTKLWISYFDEKHRSIVDRIITTLLLIRQLIHITSAAFRGNGYFAADGNYVNTPN